MSISDRSLTLSSYDFLAKQVRSLLICFAILVAAIFLGRPDTFSTPIQILWGLALMVTIGAAVGFIANLTTIIVLQTGGEVQRRTVHTLTTILAVFIAVTASTLFALSLGKSQSTMITCFVIFIAQITAHLSVHDN
jgi:hypothetical protein